MKTAQCVAMGKEEALFMQRRLATYIRDLLEGYLLRNNGQCGVNDGSAACLSILHERLQVARGLEEGQAESAPIGVDTTAMVHR